MSQGIDYKLTNSSFEEIGRFLNENDKFIIMAHTRPDGDAYGSTLGLGLSLLAMGKDVVMVNQDGMVKRFEFMPESGQILVTPVEPPEDDRKIISVDVPRPKQFGPTFAGWNRQVDLNVDHHLGNPNFGKLNWVEPDASSAAEMLTKMIEKLDMPMNPEIASALYIGMTTDTGSFMYPATTPESFEAAAKLAHAGANTGELSTAYFSGRSPQQFKLQMEMLNATQFDDGNRIAHVCVDKGMYERSGATFHDKDNSMLEPIRTISTTEVTIILDDTRGNTKVSLRSRGDVDVEVIAAQFGGGGHTLASGIDTDMPAKELEPKLVEAVKKQLAALDKAKSPSVSKMPECEAEAATVSV
jgi:phosphoesterase RecJ-like protein